MVLLSQLRASEPKSTLFFSTPSKFPPVFQDKTFTLLGLVDPASAGENMKYFLPRHKRLEAKSGLVQNWWAKKQFVQMDEKYIKACGGIPLFVEREQTAIPSQFNTIFKSYAETALDLEEVYPLEG